MILNEVLDMDLINDRTYIMILNKDGFPIAGGNRTQSKIRKYLDADVLEMDLFSNSNRVDIRLDIFLIL